MVQGPTVGSDKSLGWDRSMGGDISRGWDRNLWTIAWEGSGAWEGAGTPRRSRGLVGVRSREGLNAGVGRD